MVERNMYINMMEAMEVDTVVDMMGDMVKNFILYIIRGWWPHQSKHFPETNIDIIIPENQWY